MENTEKEPYNILNDLMDLRKAVLQIIIPAIILFIITFIFSKDIILFILEINGLDLAKVITLTPMESIQLQINVSLVLSSVLIIPLSVWALFHFCSPAISQKYKWTIILYLYSSVALAVTGFVLGITIFSKYILASLNYYQLTDIMWSIKSVMDFILSLGFSMSLILQTTIIVPLIINIGLITRKDLIQISLIIFLAIAILAAVITPPDIVSQIVITIPFYLSFWLGIFINKLQGGKT